VKTNKTETMTRLAVALLAAASCTVAADVSASVTTNITNLPEYMLHKGDTVLVKVGIWPYFSENGLTDPNSMFPDNLFVEVVGEDHGDCQNVFVPLPPFLICGNYRFRCMAAVPSTPINDAERLYLVDLNAQLLNRSGDPKGTCYAAQAPINGTPSLMLVAFVFAEREIGRQDKQATRGLIEFLSGGSAAIQPDGTGMTFAFQFNPRPTDPQTFTIGGTGPNILVKQAFTALMNSQRYSTMRAGDIVSVVLKPAQ